ncbi:MAG: hypothetical protein ACRC0L_02430, partial [Angustibacter sp.]
MNETAYGDMEFTGTTKGPSFNQANGTHVYPGPFYNRWSFGQAETHNIYATSGDVASGAERAAQLAEAVTALTNLIASVKDLMDYIQSDAIPSGLTSQSAIISMKKSGQNIEKKEQSMAEIVGHVATYVATLESTKNGTTAFCTTVDQTIAILEPYVYNPWTHAAAINAIINTVSTALNSQWATTQSIVAAVSAIAALIDALLFDEEESTNGQGTDEQDTDEETDDNTDEEETDEEETGEESTAANQAAIDKQTEADKAKGQADYLQSEADREAEEAEAAEQDYLDAKEHYEEDDDDNDDDQADEKARMDAAKAEWEKQQAEADEAQGKADEAKLSADNLQADADAAQSEAVQAEEDEQQELEQQRYDEQQQEAEEQQELEQQRYDEQQQEQEEQQEIAQQQYEEQQQK